MMTAKRAIKKDTFFFLCLFALRGGFLPMMECRGGGKWGFGVAHGFEGDEVSFVSAWNSWFVGVKGGVRLSRIPFMFSPSWSICVKGTMISAWRKLGSGGMTWRCFRDR